jgi:hypothetical protein
VKVELSIWCGKNKPLNSPNNAVLSNQSKPWK